MNEIVRRPTQSRWSLLNPAAWLRFTRPGLETKYRRSVEDAWNGLTVAGGVLGVTVFIIHGLLDVSILSDAEFGVILRFGFGAVGVVMIGLGVRYSRTLVAGQLKFVMMFLAHLGILLILLANPELPNDYAMGMLVAGAFTVSIVWLPFRKSFLLQMVSTVLLAAIIFGRPGAVQNPDFPYLVLFYLSSVGALFIASFVYEAGVRRSYAGHEALKRQSGRLKHLRTDLGRAADQHTAVIHALGQRYAGPIHDLSNAVTGLRLRPAPNDPVTDDAITRLDESIAKFEREQARMMWYADLVIGPSAGSAETIDIEPALSRIVERSGYGSDVAFDVDRVVRPVQLPRKRFDLIVDELVRNAGVAIRGRRPGFQRPAQTSSEQILIIAEADSGEFSLTVIDEGRGLAPEIFQEAIRPITDEEFRFQGAAGIPMGLRLCAAAASSMGGSIEMNRGPYGGTIVTVTLPMRGGSSELQ